jgi:hypothetical protein
MAIGIDTAPKLCGGKTISIFPRHRRGNIEKRAVL